MRRVAWIIAGLLVLALWAWAPHGRPTAEATGEGAPRASPVSSATRGGDRHAAGADTASTHTSATARAGAGRADPTHAPRWPAFLPAEAHDTLDRIASGGPFLHRQDGAVFGNREHRLPPQPRGWYREYTVQTPGARDRGARRIVAGGDPPVEYFYTDDHYRSFRRFTDGAPR